MTRPRSRFSVITSRPGVSAGVVAITVVGIVALAITGHDATIPVLVASLPAIVGLFRIEDNSAQVGEVRSLVNGHTDRIIDSTRQMAKEAVREAAMTAVREAIKLPPEHHDDAPAAAGVTAEKVVNERFTGTPPETPSVATTKAAKPAKAKGVRRK